MGPATRLLVARLSELAAGGVTRSEAAAMVGGSYQYIAVVARDNKIPFTRKVGSGRPSYPNANSERMRELYLDGTSLEKIGAQFNMTRERVRQILTKHYGITGSDGGASEQGRRTKLRRKIALEARCQKAWGCSRKDYLSLLRRADKPTRAYAMQRRNAQERGIGWELTLWQWWQVWQQSGHWGDRGRGRDLYCMCRLNDVGPYSVDNVYLATISENMKDYWVNRRAAQQIGEAA